MRDDTFEHGLPTDPQLRKVARDTLEETLRAFPYVASDVGIHRWDDAMPDFSDAGQRARSESLGRLRSALADINPTGLTLDDWADWTTLTNQTALMTDDLVDWRPETRDPNLYNEIVSESVLSLTRRVFGLPIERAEHLIARLDAVPELLRQAERLLDNPPRIFVAVALRQFEATIPMLTEVAGAFSDLPSDRVDMLAAAGRRAAEAYGAFIEYLDQRWSTRADGDFRLGETRYQRRLGWQEGVDLPLPQLLERGYQELARLHAQLEQEVAGMGRNLSLSDVLQALRKDHPSAHTLLPNVREVLDELRQFTADHGLLSVPPAPQPDVVETPAFMRLWTFASLSTPGALETGPMKAHYQVTLPDPQAPPNEVEEHLQGFNRWSMRLISAHEVYPGHFAQFAVLPTTPSTVRKIFWSGAFVEGWAHYTEQLVVDEGYGDGEPWMRIAQIMEALERVGRYIVGIRLHAGDMTFDQAKEFFITECHLMPVHAQREAIRGTMDPFYLIYTFGKLEIYRLRERAKTAWGSEFTLKRFHDQLLAHGMPTFAVLERLLFTSS